MTHTSPPPSQAAIGRALGISPASMTKCKAMGMPVHSEEAARAWRRANIKPTAHAMRAKPTARPAPARQLSGALPHALALLNVAAAAMEAGRSITALVPTLRAALHAVPEHERDINMLLPVCVMDVMTADVAEQECAGAYTKSAETMTDDEAEYMGRFWYQVAAGEIIVA